jgi:hypothetical protein
LKRFNVQLKDIAESFFQKLIRDHADELNVILLTPEELECIKKQTHEKDDHYQALKKELLMKLKQKGKK